MTGGHIGHDQPTPSIEETGSEQTGTARVEEVWVYAGRRDSDGKKYYAWQDPHGQERYYAKVPALTVGGKYTLRVTRHGDRVSVYPDPRYTGEQVDQPTRREMEALDIAATAILAAATRDRNDARRKALDDAVAPLAQIAAKLRFGHERDAFLAYVIRRLTQRW
jgi:hypothetical protein